MAETDWEKIIDKMVDANTTVYFRVYSNEGASGIAGDTLIRNHDYYMIFYVYIVLQFRFFLAPLLLPH